MTMGDVGSEASNVCRRRCLRLLGERGVARGKAVWRGR